MKLPSLPLLLLASLLAIKPASAAELRTMGGMGLTIWPMQLEGLQGLGLGITGRLMVRIQDHLLFQAGILQGSFSEEDLSHAKNNLIFGAVAWHAPLPSNFYLLGGLRGGGIHQTLVVTLARPQADTRLVRDQERWSPALQPFLGVGRCFKDRIHLEFEAGPVWEPVHGDLSLVMNVGAYFKMGE